MLEWSSANNVCFIIIIYILLVSPQQVVRHLKTQLALRSPRAAAETLLENARVPHFRFSLPALVAAYWQGRAIRRQMIRTGLSGTVPVAAHEIRPVPRAVSRAA